MGSKQRKVVIKIGNVSEMRPSRCLGTRSCVAFVCTALGRRARRVFEVCWVLDTLCVKFLGLWKWGENGKTKGKEGNGIKRRKKRTEVSTSRG